MKVGELIREVRNARGLTQTELADRAGLTLNSVSRIERGQVAPSSTSVERIARALSVEIADLYPKVLAPEIRG